MRDGIAVGDGVLLGAEKEGMWIHSIVYMRLCCGSLVVLSIVYLL